MDMCSLREATRFYASRPWWCSSAAVVLDVIRSRRFGRPVDGQWAGSECVRGRERG